MPLGLSLNKGKELLHSCELGIWGSGRITLRGLEFVWFLRIGRRVGYDECLDFLTYMNDD